MQATIDNPDHILKPGMFATTTVVLPDKPAAVTVPETAVDYTLYGDSVFLITEKKARMALPASPRCEPSCAPAISMTAAR